MYIFGISLTSSIRWAQTVVKRVALESDFNLHSRSLLFVTLAMTHSALFNNALIRLYLPNQVDKSDDVIDDSSGSGLGIYLVFHLARFPISENLARLI